MSHFKTVLTLILFCSSLAIAQQKASGSSSSSSSGMMQRATAREVKRWTLQEWMEQKSKNSLMDQWLNMHEPSPFEFMIGGSSLNYSNRISSPFSEASFTSSNGEIAAYAQIVGLSVEYENNSKEKYNDLNGQLNFRILGNSLQSTSITIAGGQRTRTISASATEIKVKNTFAQIKLQAYFTKFFGIDGYTRSYFPVDDPTLGSVSGTRTEIGAFIDYKALRIYANWFQDIEIDKTSTTNIETKRTGTATGVKIFF